MMYIVGFYLVMGFIIGGLSWVTIHQYKELKEMRNNK